MPHYGVGRGLQGDLTKEVAPGVGLMQLSLNFTFAEIRLVQPYSVINAPAAPTCHMELLLRGASI